MPRRSTSLLIARSFVTLALVLALPCVARAASAAREYRTGAAGEWVSADVPTSSAAPALEATDGTEYVALDRQVRIDERGADAYTRFIVRIVSEAGVEEGSTIELEFDPHSEQITMHAVRVVREGKTIDQLARAQFTVLRREKRLEQGLLDGHLTLSVVLEDVRPGDVLDYSYTRHTFDPTTGTRFYDSYTTQWSTPVRWSRIRLLRPVDRRIATQRHGPTNTASIEAVERRVGGLIETTWVWRDLPGIPSEANRPSWYPLYPSITISEWQSWGEVATWAEPLYRQAQLSTELRALIERWVQTAATDAERIVLALRFVQDQVRYTGIEIGAGGFTPTAPARVFERRYGDCKDKALLLVTALRAMNIDAHVALVNTALRHEVARQLPSPGAFDHAVVRVRHEGTAYWFDATRTLQGGELTRVSQAHYGAALVIEPGARKLEPMPEETRTQPTTEVIETFDLRDVDARKAVVTVRTIYDRADADTMRRSLKSSTTADTSRSYLDFYREIYPGISQTSPIEVTDDRERNRIVITEHYTLDPVFVKQDDGSSKLELDVHAIATLTKAPDQTHRSSPLNVSHPSFVRQREIVLFPSAWQIKSDVVKVDDPAFTYRSRITYKARRFEGVYDFRTLASHVEAERAEAYATKLEQAYNDTSYWFSEAEPDNRPAGNLVDVAKSTSWALGIQTAIGTIGLIVIVALLVRQRR